MSRNIALDPFHLDADSELRFVLQNLIRVQVIIICLRVADFLFWIQVIIIC